MFKYCKKCAYIANIKTEGTAVCPACETELLPVPGEYLTATGFMFRSPDGKERLLDMIKQGQDFDSDSYGMRDDIIAGKASERKAQVDEMVEEYRNAEFHVTCPICRSHNVSKISNVGKVVKVGAFGILGAGDIGKIYKCRACGYRF